MDPNNKFDNTNPLGQSTAPQPAVATPSSNPIVPPTQQPTQSPAPTPDVSTSMPQAPKGKGKKGIALLIILLLLILGMGAYVFFVKNQLNIIRKTSTDNANTVAPTATIVPTATPATVEEIEVASPDADLKTLEDDVQGL